MLQKHEATLWQECRTEQDVIFSNREKKITLIVPKTSRIGYRHQITVTIQEELLKGGQ